MSSIKIVFSIAQVQEMVRVLAERSERGESAVVEMMIPIGAGLVGGGSSVMGGVVNVRSERGDSAVVENPTAPLSEENLEKLKEKGYYVKTQMRTMAKDFKKMKVPESLYKNAHGQWVSYAKENGMTEKPEVNEQEKRILNGYMRFASEKRQEFKTKNPGMSPTEITSLLGRSWQELSEAEKAPYKLAHALEKESRAASVSPASAASA